MVYLSMDVDCGVGDVVGPERRVLGVEDDHVAPVFERMIPRFLDFAAENDIVLTFFLVASTINTPARKAMLQRMIRAGHEIASHSLTHPKTLGRLGPREMKLEVSESKRLLEDAAGVEVTGFRAPGFYINNRVLDAVIEAGYRYSSSVNSALGYNLAKLVVGNVANVLTKASTAYPVEPQSLLAPRYPYRPAPGCFWRAGDGPPFCEIPVSMGFGRMLPGVTFAIDSMLPAGLRALFFSRMVDRLPVVNIVLHDFEFVETDDFHPDTKLPRTTAMLQNVPRERKRKQLQALLHGRDRRYGLLRDLAASVREQEVRAAQPAGA